MLTLVVTPEDPGNKGGTILHLSPTVRAKASNHETYLIHISEKVLKKAGVPIPSRLAEPSPFAETIDDNLTAIKSLREKVHRISKQQVDDERIKRKGYKKFEKRFLEEISRLPRKLVNEEFVLRAGGPSEKPVEELNRKAIVQGTEQKVTKKRLTRFFLTEEQRKQLGIIDSAQPGQEVEYLELRRILQNLPSPGGDISDSDIPTTPMMIQQANVPLACIKKTDEEQLSDKLLLGIESGTSSEDTESSNGNGDETSGNLTGANVAVTAASEEDIPRYVAALFNDLTSPEQRIQFGLPVNGDNSAIPARPDQDDVAKNIGALSLRTGPADQPAFYDFHSLQIAFDHVWEELISNEITETLEASYQQTTDLGGNLDPDDEIHREDNSNGGTQKSAFQVLRDEAAVVATTLGHGENPSVMYKRKNPMGSRSDWTNLDLPGEDIYPPPPTDPEPDDDEGEDNGDSPLGGIAPPKKDSGGKFKDTTPRGLLGRLNELLNTDYAFTTFAANHKERSVNFGITVTYRQKWEPVAYQAGELAKTITLAPKETRKFTSKTVVKRKRSEKEVENASQVRKDEFNQTSRAEAEIIRKANTKTNFNLSTDGTYNLGFAEGTTETETSRDSEKDSSETKKDFREAVSKAAQEFKNERKVEVSIEESEEFEETESGELTNPNDELAVTFLFYELQRRYRIHEEIHRIMPVVLVAQEVPNPGQINDAWLIAHDWVLNRALLDDSFRQTLRYLSEQYRGDLHTLGHQRGVYQTHKGLVDKLQTDILAAETKEDTAYKHLQDDIEARAREVRNQETDSFWSNVGEFFGGGADEAPESARVVEEASRDAHERAVAEAKELTMRLQREVTALNAASEKYAKLLTKLKSWEVKIARLRLHIKQNILYYMQAIWAHEVPDQRYFRLFQVKVPTFVDNGTKYQVVDADASDGQVIFSVENPQSPETAKGVTFEISPSLEAKFEGDLKSLVEVADIDKLLGFKGNYAIFPLKESNPLTDVMMDPYVDQGFKEVLNLVDPDPDGNMSRQDFAKYVACLYATLPEGEFEGIKEALKEQYKRILLASNRLGEEIVVPTGSLFIEALPATHPLLEDFKLVHRAIDVKKVQAEVRDAELENLRTAARLLSENYEDPDIEKKIVIEGDSQNVTVPTDDE
ncbi:MAG: hypothetical protein V3W31_08950 [Thermodesulfobacteriota bacterium]